MASSRAAGRGADAEAREAEDEAGRRARARAINCCKAEGAHSLRSSLVLAASVAMLPGTLVATLTPAGAAGQLKMYHHHLIRHNLGRTETIAPNDVYV